MRAGLAPFLEHAHAVHLGQAEIEDHRVVRFGVAEEMAFLAIAGRIDHIARIAQRALQQALQIVIVFDQKNAHRRSAVSVCNQIRHAAPNRDWDRRGEPQQEDRI